MEAPGRRLANGKILVTLLSGSFSYASARELARRAPQAVTGVEVVIYDFSHAGYVDISAALAIDETITLAQDARQQVIVSGLGGPALRALDGLGVLARVPVNRRFDERMDAIKAAWRWPPNRRPMLRRNVGLAATRSAGGDFRLRLADQAFALSLLANQLARAAHRFALLPRSFLGRLLVKPLALDLPEDAFALHLFLQDLHRLIDIVVTNVDLQKTLLSSGATRGAQ
jgi:hypothetical protein